MMADFPIEPKPHERTSKLVVMIAKSATVRDILEAQETGAYNRHHHHGLDRAAGQHEVPRGLDQGQPRRDGGRA